jgi:hypothetical protein
MFLECFDMYYFYVFLSEFVLKKIIITFSNTLTLTWDENKIVFDKSM